MFEKMMLGYMMGTLRTLLDNARGKSVGKYELEELLLHVEHTVHIEGPAAKKGDIT